MKRIGGIVALYMLLSMTACADSGEIASTPSAEISASKEITTEKPSKTESESENTVTTTEVKEEFTVDEGLFTTKITIPASFISDLDETLCEAEANEDILDYTVNDDGSVTYTYKKSEYNKMVAEMRSGFDAMVDEQLASGNYTTFSSIIGDDTLENVTLTVTSQQEYEATWDGLIVWGLYIYIGYYQIYSGDAPTENDIKTTFHFVDGTNGTEFDTVIYPDAMQAE